MPWAKLFSTPSHICFPFFLSLIQAMTSNASLSHISCHISVMFKLVAEQSQLACPGCHHLPAGLELLSYPSDPGRKHRSGSFVDVEFSWFCRSRSKDLCCGTVGLGWKSGFQECNCQFVCRFVASHCEGEAMMTCGTSLWFCPWFHTRRLGREEKKTLHKTL